jgi:DNA-directed RNA polymerase sigma subunit (sigma70/sigma32)
MSHPGAKNKARSELQLAVYTAVAPARPHTLGEIAKIMDVTKERVRQIESEAIRKLRRKINSVMKDDKIEESDIISCLMRAEG